MSCCHPLKAFRTGYKTVNGKDDYIIVGHSTCPTLSTDHIKKPVLLDQVPHLMMDGHAYLTDPLDVPCGKCVGCRMQRAKEWKIRNCLELEYAREAYFVTLTYDDDNVPFNECGEPVLVKRDLQLFLKRLRKYIGQFRYFGCGEYGENTGRPHFHLLLYGHLEGFELVGVSRFSNPTILKAWNKGHILVESVDPGSIAYVCGYVEKKQADPKWFDYPVKPFLVMSRKPGIGMVYLVDNYDSIKSTKKVYGLFGNGTTNLNASMPHAFRRNLEGVPWFEDYRLQLREFGKQRETTLKATMHQHDVWRINDSLEESLYFRLQKVRNTSL